MTPHAHAIRSPFGCVADLLDGLVSLERGFLRANDNRAAFASAYVESTQMIGSWLQSGRFHNHGHIDRYVVAFGNLYREALLDFEERPADAPRCWSIAFDAARSNHCSVVQALMLGINAHVNHDLPLAMIHADVDFECRSHTRDHALLNDALQAASPRVRKRVMETHPMGALAKSRFVGRFVDLLTTTMFRVARGNAWTTARALRGFPSDEQRRLMTARIDDRATAAAERILQAKRSLLLQMRTLGRGGSSNGSFMLGRAARLGDTVRAASS